MRADHILALISTSAFYVVAMRETYKGSCHRCYFLLGLYEKLELQAETPLFLGLKAKTTSGCRRGV